MSLSVPTQPQTNALETNSFSHWQRIDHTDFYMMSASEWSVWPKKKPPLIQTKCASVIYSTDVVKIYRVTLWQCWVDKALIQPHSLVPQMRLCGPIMMCDLWGQPQHRGVILTEEDEVQATGHNACCFCSMLDFQYEDLVFSNIRNLMRAQGLCLQIILALSLFLHFFLFHFSLDINQQVLQYCNGSISTFWGAHEQMSYCCHAAV